jgi:hypothetical protein
MFKLSFFDKLLSFSVIFLASFIFSLSKISAKSLFSSFLCFLDFFFLFFLSLFFFFLLSDVLLTGESTDFSEDEPKKKY